MCDAWSLPGDVVPLTIDNTDPAQLNPRQNNAFAMGNTIFHSSLLPEGNLQTPLGQSGQG